MLFDFFQRFLAVCRGEEVALEDLERRRAHALDVEIAEPSIGPVVNEAAALADNPSLKKYLELRAEAIRTDDYYASDLAWMDTIVGEDEVLGAALHFVHGQTVYYYMGGFDDRIRKVQPGTGLLGQVIHAHHVGSGLPRGLDQGAGQQVRRHRHEGTHRARRRKSDMAERSDSFILHKFEAILSWAEFLNLNRRVDDDDNDNNGDDNDDNNDDTSDDDDDDDDDNDDNNDDTTSDDDDDDDTGDDDDTTSDDDDDDDDDTDCESQGMKIVPDENGFYPCSALGVTKAF